MTSACKNETARLDLYAAVPCVVKLPFEAYLREAFPQAGAEAASFRVDPADFADEHAPQADILIGTGYERLFSWQENNRSNYMENAQIIASIPLVLAVDKSRLNGRPLPRSFQDLCQPEWEASIVYTNDESFLSLVILPTLSFVLSKEDLRRFYKNLSCGRHPSQMQRRGRESFSEAIFILPYFFAQLKSNEKDVVVVLPEDGAPAAPVFCMRRKTETACNHEFIVAFMKALRTPAFADAFSANGSFPMPCEAKREPDDLRLLFLPKSIDSYASYTKYCLDLLKEMD